MTMITFIVPEENERTVTEMAEYIEREAAIAAITSDPPDAHYPHWYADKIKAIPAADVAPVRPGRWITVGVNYYRRISQCTNCCAKYDFRPKYCPNCGARMDEEAQQ